jgi:hypothetical protein
VVDHAPPSFDLLVRRNSEDAPLPQFKRNQRKADQYSNGLTLFKSDQCPYVHVMDDGIQQIGRELKIPVNIVQLERTREAQNMPCNYGVMGLYYHGELLTYHPIGKKQILEILESRISS